MSTCKNAIKGEERKLGVEGFCNHDEVGEGEDMEGKMSRRSAEHVVWT